MSSDHGSLFNGVSGDRTALATEKIQCPVLVYPRWMSLKLYPIPITKWCRVSIEKF